MTDLERPERLQIMLSKEELEALENWRFERRMPSRAAAVRELLRRGLSSDGFIQADHGRKSRDFSVVDRRGGDGASRDGRGRADGNGRRHPDGNGRGHGGDGAG